MRKELITISEIPMSRSELEEILTDINRIISEITRDRIAALFKQDHDRADRLLNLQLQYMQDKEDYQKQLHLLRRSKYG